MRFLLNVSPLAPRGVEEIQTPTETRMSLFHGHEGHGRSFIKAVSWRTVGTIDTFTIPRHVTLAGKWKN